MQADALLGRLEQLGHLGLAQPYAAVARLSNLERIVRIKTVLARTGLSRSTLYRKIAEGTFPCQVKISVHGAGWRESAVNRWIADPIGYREEQHIRRSDERRVGKAGVNRVGTRWSPDNEKKKRK